MANCRECGKPIRFIKTSKGKFQPIEMDSNEPHFATCGKILTREYWEPREKIKNAERRITKPFGRKSFYFGERPPWDYSTYIECYERISKKEAMREENFLMKANRI